MATRALIPFLVAMMLLTGVTNTLLTKYQDNQCARDCDDPDPRKRRPFHQPVLQTAQMFVGEMGCWLVIGLASLYRRYISKTSARPAGYEALHTNEADADADAPENGNATHEDDRSLAKSENTLRGRRILLLAIPATCDILGTTLMNAGLLMVAASIYQMTRGALVLFVGLMSVWCLGRKLHLFQWISLVGVMLGVAIVGLAGAIWPDEKKAAATAVMTVVSRVVGGDEEIEGITADPVKVIVGVLLIAGAQIFTATQFVVEEWLLERSTIEPIRVVGWEGVFGFITTVVGMIVLHLAIGRTEAGQYGYFDMVEGWRQMMSKKELWVSSILIMISIGGFNFFGLSVTRSVSATSRSTIDTCRTLFIWMISLGLRWETFKWLQVVGFALLVYFTFLFNGVVNPPFKFLEVEEEVEELLPEEPIEHQ